MNDRSSEADHPQLVTNPGEIARIEAENTLRQFDDSMSELTKWLAGAGYRLKISTILRFNRIALDGVSAFAGTFRPGPIKISGSNHVPPNAEDVPALMEDFCDYIRDHWRERSAIHLSAYALWRLNWIHPFVDGNGRTARVVSYLILCARLGYRLPGLETIPEQIASNKRPYYAALEQGDQATSAGRVDVSDLEKLLGDHLARQLLRIHDAATGSIESDRAAIASIVNSPTPPSKPDEPSQAAFARAVRHIERHPVIYTCAFGLAGIALTIVFQR